jgi:hypothetical protein
MSTPVAGSLSVTPLYASAADVLVLWDDVNATWRSLPSVSAPMSVGQGGTGQTALALNRPLIGNGTSPVLSSTIVTDNGTTLQVSTNVVIGNAVTSPPSHALTINAAATSPQPANALIFGASEGATPYVIIDSYSATPGNGGGLTTRRTRGTAAGPTAVQSGDNLLALCAQGWGASGFGIGALIAANATENWTNTAQGAAIAFNTTANTTGANVERMRIDHNGNVGIGTTTPAFKLHVHHATDVNFMLFNNGGRSALAALNDANNVWNPIDINPSGDVYLSSASGNVGIGTTAPTEKFTVSGGGIKVKNGVMTTNEANAGGIDSATGLTRIFSWGPDNATVGTFQLLTQSANGSVSRSPIITAANGDIQLVGSGTGNVGIGTTAPRVKLEVAAASPNIALTDTAGAADRKVFDWFSSGGGLSGRVVNDAYSGATNWIAVTRGAGLTIANVGFPNGTTNNVTGAWVVISDPSVKQDVVPYARGLEAITALEPVQFRYRPQTPFNEGNEPSHVLYGLMADQVRPHVPEIVGTTTGTIGKKEGVELSTLEPGNLIYALINAVKELKSELDALKGGGVAPARLAR